MSDINGMKFDNEVLISEISYALRDPLNAVSGISEIALKSLDQPIDTELLREYLEMINDAASKMQSEIDKLISYVRKEEKEMKAEKYEEESYAILKNLRILVCEDSSVSQLIAKELLESKGAIVTVCNNGEDAVDLFTNSISGTYDVIFMDIHMPGIDGHTATQIIRNSSHPQASSIPIIAMTAEAMAKEVKASLEAGMNAHVAKPIHLDRMVAAIKGVI